MVTRYALPVLLCLLAALVSTPARADGGKLRLSERAGACQISVFTTPTPVRVGAVDISVLVQDAKTSDLIREAEISISARPAHGHASPIVVRASHAAATNRLLQAAYLDFPQAGLWTVDLVIRCRGQQFSVDMPLEVAGALPGWLELWPWLTVPLWPVLLFATHHLLRLHDQASRPTQGDK